MASQHLAQIESRKKVANALFALGSLLVRRFPPTVQRPAD